MSAVGGRGSPPIGAFPLAAPVLEIGPDLCEGSCAGLRGCLGVAVGLAVQLEQEPVAPLGG